MFLPERMHSDPETVKEILRPLFWMNEPELKEVINYLLSSNRADIPNSTRAVADMLENILSHWR